MATTSAEILHASSNVVAKASVSAAEVENAVKHCLQDFQYTRFLPTLITTPVLN